jgi:hypothetical protein
LPEVDRLNEDKEKHATHLIFLLLGGDQLVPEVVALLLNLMASP